MFERRTFLKSGLIMLAGLSVARTASASETAFPAGIVYTAENPGKWAEKIKGHAPTVTLEGNKLTIKNEHIMTEVHYIVRHTLVSATGEVLGEKTFSPNDEEAVSVFEIPEGQDSLFATSFCNKHDLWVTEVKR